MYKNEFNQANNKIKMSDELKEKILCEMQEQSQKKKMGKILIPERKKIAAVVASLVVVLSIVSVGAVSVGWKDEIKQFFRDRLENAYDKNPNLDYNGDNFITDEQLEAWGQKVELKAESGGLTASITGLMMDKYTLYGVIELTGDEIHYNLKHKETGMNLFDIDFGIEHILEMNKETGEMDYPFDGAYYRCYQLGGGDESKLKYVFAYNMETFADVEGDESPFEENINYFANKNFSIDRLSTLCDCKECKEMSYRINEILKEKELVIHLPEEIRYCEQELYVKGPYDIENYYDSDYRVVNHKAMAENIIITPFSIRYLQTSNEDWIPKIKIVFQDGTIFNSVDMNELTSSERENKALMSGTFSKPINLDKVKSIIIGDDELEVER